MDYRYVRRHQESHKTFATLKNIDIEVAMDIPLILKKTGSILGLIKFPHTIFSLPFAVMSALLASGGLPYPRQLFFILGALIAARSAAMSFNRLVDTGYDHSNPRTAYRVELQEKIGRRNLWIFTIFCISLFLVFAWLLNYLALYLSPLAILIIFGYSYTKRFTHLSHFVLGLALALSPVGAWIGIRGTMAFAPVLLAIAVVLWTAGFDIIYACQDIEHDISSGLYSIPKKLGIKGALILSGILHFLMVIVLLILPMYTGLGIIYSAGICIIAALLFYEHSLVRPNDLSRLNTAFFTVNGMISIGIMCITMIDIFIQKTGF
ncbi:MAG: UbiA-like polyprenyltransferase [Candidatus Brocadiaceae baterium WH-1]|nr:MAG: UbiA-like polyprenyltransferase [Candidatus Jettenia sp. AMX2]